MTGEGTIQEVLSGAARWSLTCGDCRDVLPTLGDKSVAHVITDPPYSKDLYSRTRTNKGTGLRPNGKPVSSGEIHNANRSALSLASLSIGSIDEMLDEVAGEMLRVASRWVIAYHDCEIGDRWRAAFGDSYVRTGAWVKSNPMPQISGDRPAAGFEPCTIAHASDGRMRWNGGGRAAVWVHPNASGHERPNHPCPKPFGLMLDMIDDFTDAGDVVVDPFSGSATTGLACLRRGRRFIGVEKEPTFYAEARARLRGLISPAITRQSSIFDALVTP